MPLRAMPMWTGVSNSMSSGGGRGIRTPVRVAPQTVFKTAGFNHSPIPPYLIIRRQTRCLFPALLRHQQIQLRVETIQTLEQFAMMQFIGRRSLSLNTESAARFQDAALHV